MENIINCSTCKHSFGYKVANVQCMSLEQLEQLEQLENNACLNCRGYSNHSPIETKEVKTKETVKMEKLSIKNQELEGKLRGLVWCFMRKWEEKNQYRIYFKHWY